MELKKSTLSKHLNSSLFIIWFSKLIIYFNSLEKFDSDFVCAVEAYSKPRSRKDPSFFWAQSFSSIIDGSILDKNITIKGSIFSSAYRKLKISVQFFFNFAEYLFVFFLITIYVYLLNKEVIVFCKRRIDGAAVKFFYESGSKKKETKARYLGVRTNNFNNLNFSFSNAKSLNNTQKDELGRILMFAAKKSLSDVLVSDYDALMFHKQLLTTINNIENYFPRDLIRSKGWFSSYILEKFRYKGRLVMIDDSGEILRNNTLLKLCHNFSFNFYGYQHGGQYGELRSINTAFEITNAAYDLGFLGWGFGLNYANFRSKPKYDKTKIIGFRGCRGIVYPQSIETIFLETSTFNSKAIEKIKHTKIEIIKCLMSSGLKYWVKPHPKSQQKKTYDNVGSKQIISGGWKSCIDTKSVGLVVFDAPGQTLMYGCIDQRVKFIFCFSLSSYNLTNAGYAYYNKLAKKNLFINSDLIDYEYKLKLAISKSFNGVYSTILNP
ncbi:hypothetical protein OAA47_00415 [Methylophilaceae bacterium]|nr:hypothetical protein [Methylophilaceae bacterium]